MLCYVMLCYVMLCYVMLCYVMLCYVMLCYVMLCYVMLCYVMLCYTYLHIFVSFLLDLPLEDISVDQSSFTKNVGLDSNDRKNQINLFFPQCIARYFIQSIP